MIKVLPLTLILLEFVGYNYGASIPKTFKPYFGTAPSKIIMKTYTRCQ
jgi:hypothetical protein